MEEILSEYRKLFIRLNKAGNSYSEKNMAAFNARKGKNYKNELMIIGRAVNGWIFNFSKNTEGIITENDIETTVGNLSKDLIKEHNLIDEIIYNIKTLDNKVKKYNPNSSAFCRMKKILASKITGGKINEANNSIVWSNLYKISNGHGGNPSAGLIKAQQEICKEILKQEIDFFNPKVVIFMTGHFANPFLNYLGVKNVLTEKMTFVTLAGIYNGRHIIVGQHPQGRKQPPHIAEIMAALNTLNIN
jgi:hypothetical protein